MVVRKDAIRSLGSAANSTIQAIKYRLQNVVDVLHAVEMPEVPDFDGTPSGDQRTEMRQAGHAGRMNGRSPGLIGWLTIPIYGHGRAINKELAMNHRPMFYLIDSDLKGMNFAYLELPYRSPVD
jgi:hypothetical protein